MTWEITVAIAAPFTPKFSPKIKIGSRIIFIKAPIKSVIMENLGFPSDLIAAFVIYPTIVIGKARDIIFIYSIEYIPDSLLAPKKYTILFKDK